MDVESVVPTSHEPPKETTTEQVSKANTLGFIEDKQAQTIIQHTNAAGGGEVAPSSQGRGFLKGRTSSRVVQVLAQTFEFIG